MMRTAAALFSAALVLCAAVSAQAPKQAPQNGIPVTVTTIGPDGQQKTTTVVIHPACPVVMQARQGGLTMLVKAGKQPQTPPQYDPMPKPSQHIHLILMGFGKDKNVTAATVTARGLSARGRIDRESDSAGAGGLRRTMNVTFAPDDNGAVSADLDLPAFTSVSSIQIESITYSDGSTWKLAHRNQCITSPDPVMLVAGN